MNLAEIAAIANLRRNGKPLGLERKRWPARFVVRHNHGMPIVLGRRAVKQARLARKKARAAARRQARRP